MKKSAIWVLVTVTLIFISFVGGVYVGRNFNHTDIHVVTPTTAPPAASSPSDPMPSGSQSSTGGSHAPSNPTTVSMYPININTATAEQLDLLPEIGPVLAQRIVAYREEFGPYTAVEDLLNVSGIGEKTLAKIISLITV